MEDQNQDYKNQCKKLLDIDNLEKKLDENAIKIDNVNIMFLDVSSTCVGYSIASVNFKTKHVNFTDSGCIWFHGKWKHQVKYNYMFNAIVNYFWIVKKIDHIIVEQYRINPKKMMGVEVVIEMQGVIKCAAEENGVNVTSMPIQTWRSVLGVKPDITFNDSGKKIKDYKKPTKKIVEKYIKIPEKVISNISSTERKTPSDLYDALAIGIGWLEKNNFKKPTFNKMKINSHIGGFN